VTDFDERYRQLSGPARALLDHWLSADRAAAPDVGPPGPAAPGTPAEELLLRIWRDVLDRADVGVEDDYLAAGGDSIRAIVIVARAEAAGLRFTTRDLLDARTVRALAAVADPAPGDAVPGDAAPGDAAPGEPAPSDAAPRDAVPAAAPPQATPLTPLQEGMLFHTLAAGPGVYVTQVSCDLVGDLDAGAFRQAWQAVIDAHPALRCTFHWSGDAVPTRRVSPAAVAPWDVRDVRGDADPDAAARRHAAALPPAGFDLGVAPLLQLGLYRTADTVHRFVLTHHHLLLDGWSQHLVLADVLDAYAAIRSGAGPHPPRRPGPDAAPPPPDGAAARAFWSAELDGAPRSAAPTVRPAAAATLSLDVPEHVGAGLAAFCAAAGVTLALAVSAAWAVALSRSRQAADVVVGITVSGRSGPDPALVDAVGMFINTVPLRVVLDPDADPARWLGALARRRACAEAHEAVPLASIARWAGLAPGTALFDSIVVVENFPGALTGPTPPAGLRIERVTTTVDEAWPLVLQAGPGPAPVLVLRHDPVRHPPAEAAELLAAAGDVLATLAAGSAPSLRSVVAATDAAAVERAAGRHAALRAAAARSLARSVRAAPDGGGH
jgi:aryl carrier-like protein